MALGSAAFAFAAGVLSILSPCVLPILPIVFGAALAQDRWAPVALAAGIAVSFTAAGLFIATIGFALGFNASWLRDVAAVLLIAFAFVLLVPALEGRFALAVGGFGASVNDATRRLAVEGARGQFLLGLALGVAWSPCVGPTLGAASLLAAQGRELGAVATTMLAFALGASLPLIGIGLLSQRLSARWRGRLQTAGHQGRLALGAVAAMIGLLILTGLDRPLEALLVNASPLWLTQLTTRF
jgi:cytochrome c-type biogenesis protein